VTTQERSRRALRRRHCVCGGALVNKSAAAAKHFFSKGPEKNFVLSSKFSHDLFLIINRKLATKQKKYTAKMTSAALRQIIGGDGAARPAQGSRLTIPARLTGASFF